MAEFGSFLGNNGNSADNICVDMLDFGFIKDCNDIIQMRQIVDVLRSGKEGHYPDLQTFAEAKLMELLPEKERNRINRLQSHASIEDEIQAKTEISSWLDELESSSVDGKKTSSVPIRRPPRGITGHDENSTDIYSNVSSTNTSDGISHIRKMMIGDRERAKGNEFYNEGEYKKAFNCYSEAIKSVGNTESRIFTNRAIVNIKLGKFTLAEADCTTAIEIETKSKSKSESKMKDSLVKAFSRRGLARFKMGKYGAAIDDFALAYQQRKSVDLLKLLESAKIRYEEVEGRPYYNFKNSFGDFLAISVKSGILGGLISVLTTLENSTSCIYSGICNTSQRISINGASNEGENENDSEISQNTFRRVAVISDSDSSDDEKEGEEENLSSIIEAIKNNGNSEISKNEYSQGIVLYSDALDLILKSKSKKYDYEKLMIACLNNRAAAFLHLMNFTSAIDDTTRVLNVDASNIKALYRRAVAYKQIDKFSSAIDDLEKLLTISPSNSQAQLLLEKIRGEKNE